MLLNNNNGIKVLTKKIMNSDKKRNLYTVVSITLTSLLLSIVSYIGVVFYEGSKALVKVDKASSFSILEMYSFAFLIFIVMFSGYLIIYNIFYISIVKDIRFYGQLKTIGCTKKQIEKIISFIVIKISLICIPIGVILGLVLGRLIGNMILKETIIGEYINLNNYLIPSIIAILFTYLTLYRSIKKPVKLASEISPIEALKYNSTDIISFNNKKKTRKGTKGGKIKNMAYANIVKNKKKVALSVISIALSSTLFIFALVSGLGLDVDEHSKRYNIGDVSASADSATLESGIDEEKIKEIENLNGVKRVESVYEGVEARSGIPFSTYPTLKLSEEAIKEFENYTESYDMRKDIQNKTIQASIKGFNEEEIEKQLERVKIVDGKFDKEKFKSGKYIILNRKMSDVTNGLKAGDKITIEINNKKEEFEIMTIIKDYDENYIKTNFGILTLEKERIKEIFKDKAVISSIDIFTDKTKIRSVEEEVKNILNRPDLDIKSKESFKDGISSLKTGIISGVSIGALIFGVIAVLNIINIITSDLLTRKREFAMLEAIGMEFKNQKKLLTYEGAYYVLFSFILIIPLGLIASLIAPKFIPIYGGFNLLAYLISVLIVIFIIILLTMVLPRILLKGIKDKESVVERLKEE